MVEITASTLAGNTARDGGGLLNTTSLGGSGVVTITHSTLSDNRANREGGGLFNRGSNSTVTIHNSILAGNVASELGGELFNNGGGIFNTTSGVVTITHSTLSGNRADNNGGGIANRAGGAVEITASTLAGNRANREGGGIGNDGIGSTVAIHNSTLSGNRANREGGGLFNAVGEATLISTTIANNRADADGNGAGTGGGIYRASGTVNLHYTLVAGNVRGAVSSTTRDDVNGELDKDGSFNLIGDGTDMTGLNTAPAFGNQIGTGFNPIDPMLGPLQNNGGPTATHALLAGSPAIDAGDNANAPMPFDQRGVKRIFGGTVDIGAFEAQPFVITIVAGKNQSATVATDFATPLQVTVTDTDGNPVSRVFVAFTAPGSGASGRFGGSLTALVLTDSNGLATAPTFTANTIAGSYTVTASTSHAPTSAGFSLTNTPDVAVALVVTGPSQVVRNVPFSFTVTVRDQFGNIATGYTGTVRFTSTDRNATLPDDYTFTADDGGVRTFTASLRRLGAQTLTVTDLANPSLTGSLVIEVVRTISSTTSGNGNGSTTADGDSSAQSVLMAGGHPVAADDGGSESDSATNTLLMVAEDPADEDDAPIVIGGPHFLVPVASPLYSDVALDQLDDEEAWPRLRHPHRHRVKA